MINQAGINKRSIITYTLYNYQDFPEDFLNRVRDLLNWGVVSYPMRYEPLVSLKKNKFIGTKWEKNELDSIAQARRVIGFYGVFPPYKALVDKFNKAKDFNEAFYLRPPRHHDELQRINRELLRDKNLVNKAKEVPKWGGSLYWKDEFSQNKRRIYNNQSSIINEELDGQTK